MRTEYYLELVDVRTLGALERSGLRQGAHFVLEGFVSQVEDHRLLADRLLAHQAVLHGGGSPPAGSSLARPAPVSSPGSLAASLRPGPHHGVVELEDFPVRHTVVNSQVVTDFGFIRTSIHWTFEWSALQCYRHQRNILSPYG